MKNKNVKRATIAAILLLIIVFLLSFFWPFDKEWANRNLSWLIPLIIAVFLAPLVPFSLGNWDIHFYFKSVESKDKLSVIIMNIGATPFNFNRIQFATRKIFNIFGKETYYPPEGISGTEIEYHGADTPSQTLYSLTGCTLRKGMPIEVTIRGNNLKDYIEYFDNKSEIHICLWFKDTEQRVFSQKIPLEVILKVSQLEPTVEIQGDNKMSNGTDWEKAKAAHDTAINLQSLASNQIYSRFSSMLTANSIIIAIIGIFLIKLNVTIPIYLVICFIIGGIIICAAWSVYLLRGLKVENHFRSIAKKLEPTIFPEGTEVSISLEDKSFRGFRAASICVIAVFILIYIFLFIYVFIS